jgi:hypothetical protein
MNANINRYATVQSGSTCWFHSILNGFILNRIGRVYLKRALFNYKRQLSGTALREFESANTNTSGVCPRSLVNSRSFFKKLQKALNSGSWQRFNSSNVGNLLNVSENIYQDQYVKIVDFMVAIGMNNYTDYYRNSQVVTPAPSGEAYIHIDSPSPLTRTLVTPRIRNSVARNYSFVTIQLKSTGQGQHRLHFITGTYDSYGDEWIIDSNGFKKQCKFEDILTDPDYTAWCIQKYGSKFTEKYYALRVYIERGTLPIRNTVSILPMKRERNISLRRNNQNRPAKRARKS